MTRRKWKLSEYLVERLGAATVLDEILRKLNADEMNEYLENTARDHGYEMPFVQVPGKVYVSGGRVYCNECAPSQGCTEGSLMSWDGNFALHCESCERELKNAYKEC